MENELYPGGALWFVERFCPTQTIQIFVCRLNGLAGFSSDAGQKMRLRRDQFARYDFTFLPTLQGVLVVPNKPASEWARGIIRQEGGQFQYCTTGEIQLTAIY